MEKKKDITTGSYKVAYALFFLLALYQVIGRKDFIDGASSLGIALIFDPFDRSVTWTKRPYWQRAWLIIHLAIVGALFGYGVAIDR